MPRSALTLVAGGRNQPEMIAVARADLEELRAELAVSRAERLAAAVATRRHARSVLYWLAVERPDDAERHATEILRLSAREEARARAAGFDGDGEPTVLAIAA